MNTKEAIRAMLDGKRVIAVDDNVADFEYCYFDGSNFRDHNNDEIDWNYWLSKYSDWETYKEPKPKDKVVIEKWLCANELHDYLIIEADNLFHKRHSYTKIKLLGTYEVEL